jgi:cysteinyl-tRNA synthetase
MELKLYNTATRSKEIFTPLKAGTAQVYCCGPTVYGHQHIGNMRTYVFEDVLRRVLEKFGYQVTHVMNVTDVGHLQSDADDGDDKMMIAARREKKSPWDIARMYEEEFLRFCTELNIKRPHIICRATEHIPEMIAMVQTLVDKGFAYESQGNVYFDVSTFDRYTEFARLRLNEQEKTDRVEHDERKRHQADFALWFSQSKFPDQIMKWDSPWGVGFPGWHIECSAMASKYLGERFDIHCGGIDHIPVHHTNEIAQSECCFGHRWVNTWLHGEFLNDETGKMSKSKGAVLTNDVLKEEGYDPLDYRYLLLTAHYRGAIVFNFENLGAARATLANLRERVLDWRKEGAVAAQLSPAALELKKKFMAALADDLHMPIALTVLWEVAKHSGLSAGEKLALAYDFDDVMGLGLASYKKRELTPEQKSLIEQRAQARANKDWKESDRLRDELLKLGIQVKDTRDSTEWTWVS